MKVLLSGYFGFGNIGDEAILESMVKGLREEKPEVQITVLSARPEETSRIYNVNAVSRWKLGSITKSIKESDIVISGGGGLLQDITGRFTLLYYLGIIWLANFYKKRTAIVGQGFGPIKRIINRIITRRILNKVDLIILRDQESYEAISKFGIKKPAVHVAADVTLNLPETNADRRAELLRIEGIEKKGGPLIGISIRRPSKKLSKMKSEAYFRTIAASLDKVIDKYQAQFVFIPFHYPKDVVESAKIINMMKNPVHIVVKEYAPKDMIGLIGAMDLFVGMRLHSLIFSAMEGVPMAGIAYDPKVSSFLSSIGQKSIDVEEVETDSLVKIITDAHENREDIASHLSSSLPELRNKAKSTFGIFFDFFKPDPILNIGGVKIDNLNMDEAVSEIDLFVRSRKPNIVFTPNPEMIVYANRHKDFKEIINDADLKLPDGVGLLWASNVLKNPLKERVSGIDLIPRVAELAERQKYKVYLLGSKLGVAAGAEEFLKKTYPNLQIVGTYHGFFKADEEVKLIENIAMTEPQILIVGMGSPKQERWLSDKYRQLNVPVSIAVGGSLDVLAGKVRRAPKWMRRSGIEWLWRLLKQPWRIVRQIRLLKFVWLVLRNKKD